MKGAAQLDHPRSCESIEGEDAVRFFWKQAVESRCEGLMVKVNRFDYATWDR